jgi:hypothetical protein
VKLPSALFFVGFECGAWRTRLSLDTALTCAKLEGAYCCDKASVTKPHRATITEFVRPPAVSKMLDLERKSSARKLAPKRGGLVVIDGGRGR